VNRLGGKVREIEKVASLHSIKLDYFRETISLITLELPKDIEVGKRVEVVCNPSNISIGKNISGEISCINRLEAEIIQLEIGQILVSIKLRILKEDILEVIITREALDRMELKIGDRVEALLKATEISIV
jgi:molybdopterin-binding protein